MSDKSRNDETGPIGTMIGASLGPLGAAVGAVVDDDRFAVKFSVGTNADDDGMRDAETIEIEDDAESESDAAEEDAEETTGGEAEAEEAAAKEDEAEAEDDA